jgi:CubicO group peptidase (beta-lactamase class C family)
MENANRQALSIGAVVAVLLAFALSAIAFSVSNSAKAGEGQRKVTICHVDDNGKRIEISIGAPGVANHIRNHADDSLGECGNNCGEGRDCKDEDPCTQDRCGEDNTCDFSGQTFCPSDGNVCTYHDCVSEQGGCVAIDLDRQCDDGDHCTEMDTCSSGTCTGFPMDNCCVSDSQCNYADLCEPEVCRDYRCVIDEDNVIKCDPPNACFVSSECIDGGCVPLPKNCEDGDLCTLNDSCDPATGDCISDHVQCNDGEYCEGGECVEGWPTGTPESQGFDSETLASFIEETKGMGVDSLLVIRNGVMILDAYFYPYLGDRPHDVASVTKTITSTLAGIAIDHGFLESVDQTVWPLFAEEYPDIPAVGGKDQITLEHLLTLTSGLDCGVPPETDGVSLLKMMSSGDWIRHVLELDMASPPGSSYAYCSPAVHLLAAAAVEASGQSALEFAQQYLFTPLGIDGASWHWPIDPQGLIHGWGGLQLHPYAMARIGQLFLNQGTWKGVSVVSSEWVEQATQPIRYLWWDPPYFDNAYAAAGRGGQHIIVQPGRGLVVVATGSLEIYPWWAPGLLEAFQSDAPLPPNPEAYEHLMTAIADATNPPLPLDPVPPLPPLATEISGRIYRLDSNQFGVLCYSVHFDGADPSEARTDLTLVGPDGNVEEFTLPIGMDGVPRFSETKPRGFQVGMVGEWWTDENFRLLYDDLAGVTHLSVESYFESSVDVRIDFIDRTHYFDRQTVLGYWVDVDTCLIE